MFMRKLTVAIVVIGLLAGSALVTAQDETRQTVMVPMSDGTQLATEIYLPEGTGPFPVLLIRTPYSRLGIGDMGANLAENGMVVISQDVRGRYDSEGEYRAFLDERADGQAMLDWIVDQPWSNGIIATYGGSALGIAQYMLAPGANDALRCQWIEVATPNVFDAAFQHGVFRHELAELWLQSIGEDQLIAQFKDHPTPEAWWGEGSILDDFADVDVVAFHVGGWYDIFAPSTIAGFQGYQQQGQTAGQQHLIMGPWTHSLYADEIGELTIPGAKYDVFSEGLLLWLDACLLDGAFGVGDMTDLAEMPPVTYFTIGAVDEEGAPGNEWHTADTWPPAGGAEVPLYLHPNNYLSIDVPVANGGGDAFVYDPADPTPTICGANLTIPAGICDQRAVERREDVVVYSTVPLDEPLEITGDLRAEIWITTDVPDTDIAVRVTDVYPDGRSMLVVDSIMRARYRNSPDFTTEELLELGEPALLSFDLGPTSIILNAGHRLRVVISSANAPRFAPNPNTGALFLAEGETGQVAHTTILHDEAFPSAIILPVR